jgi:hypothetical protein
LRSRTPPPSPSVSTHPTSSSPLSRYAILLILLLDFCADNQLDKDRKAILERKGKGSEKKSDSKEQGDVEMVE